MAFTDLHQEVAEEFAQAGGRGREWFNSDGFGTRRLPKLRDPEFARQVRLLEVKRTEAKKPGLYVALHAKATKAWKERDPEAFKTSQRRRKQRYRQRHPDRVKAQNRRAYLNWAAKPGNLEAAGERAANRRRQA